MDTAQLQHQILSSSQGLPDELLEEVLDFIQFLKIKKSKSKQGSFQELLSTMTNNSEQHLLDEFKDYKSDFPQQ